MDVKVFEKVQSGEITTTVDFQVKSISHGTDEGYRYKVYRSLLSMISDGYIDGTKIQEGYLGPNFDHLKVTKLGEKNYNFLSTPISKLGKPTVIEVIKNGVIGGIAGKVASKVILTTAVILIPTVSEDVRNLYQSLLEKIKDAFF